jgi:hypothetical protein
VVVLAAERRFGALLTEDAVFLGRKLSPPLRVGLFDFRHALIVRTTDVLLEPRERLPHTLELRLGEAGGQVAIERDDCLSQRPEEPLPFSRELDAHRAPIAAVAHAPNDSILLEPVQMARERGAFDADSTREVELRSPFIRLQRAQDQSHRNGAAGLGQAVVESTTSRLRRVGELEPDGCSLRFHSCHSCTND